MELHSRFQTASRILLFWCLFIGVGAVAGSVGMLTAVDGSHLGMQEMLSYFQVLPLADILFRNFLFPGIALLCVNGIPNLIAAGLLLARRKAGVICGGFFGVTLMLWITIQFIILPANFMSTSYFIFGFLQAATGFAAWVFYRQERFRAENENAVYPNIGTDPTRLVVYFSRMGYTRRAACEAAQRTGAELYEIRSIERVAGTLGFWWCGRYGMHGWDMPVEEPDIDLARYEQVTVCSPVWVFSLAAPVRSFCRAAKGKLRRVDYILVHFNPMRYESVVRELDALLGQTAERAESVCVQWGKVKKRYLLRGER